MDAAEATQILREVSGGDRSAYDRLLPLIYDELRAIAARHLGNERAGHTLQPTALAHEAYLRLIDIHEVDWQSRAHFMAVAARVIRRILVDHARARDAQKRGGNARTIRLDGSEPGSETPDVDLLALDDALEELGRLKERHLRVVELRYFGGLTIEQTAHVLGVSPETVKLDWRTARHWLRARLDGG